MDLTQGDRRFAIPSSVAPRASVVLPPLPRDFKPVRLSDISSVRLLKYGDHPVTRRRPRGSTPAQKSGLRYQRKVCDELRLLSKGNQLLIGPWLEYRMGLSCRYCQPDALVFYYDIAYVFEIKYSSTTDAWWQLRHLYEPVMRVLYPEKRIVLVNVVNKFNPDIVFPEERWPLLMDLGSLTSQTAQAVSIAWRP